MKELRGETEQENEEPRKLTERFVIRDSRQFKGCRITSAIDIFSEIPHRRQIEVTILLTVVLKVNSCRMCNIMHINS